MHRKESGLIGAIIIAVIVFGCIGFVIYANVHYATNYHSVTFTVNSEDRVITTNSSKYLIYTTAGVYQDTDSFINGKFNSSDLYNQLKPGSKFTCDAVGFRNGFLSAYENLISCQSL